MAHVLVCGGGNAAQVVSCLFSSRYRVTAMSLYSDEAERWNREVREAKCMTCYFEQTKKEVKATPDLITKDPSCVKDCDIVLFTVPSSFHDQYLTALEPYVKPGTIFAVMPARSGCDFLFRKVMGAKAQNLGLAAFETLPWACRFNQWGRTATVLGTKETICAAVVPPKGRSGTEVVLKLQGLLGVEPMILESPNVMSISLGNPGQVIHPGITYGKWKDWDGVPLQQKPLFYHGVDAFTAKTLEGISEDIQSICKALNNLDKTFDVSQVKTVFQWYMSSYSGCISDSSNLQTAMSTNSAYDGLCHPMLEAPGSKGSGYVPDFQFRYLSEDVPTGLCFTKGVAILLAVRTPTIDEVLSWCQKKLNKEFIASNGRMEGADVNLTRAPQAYGVKTKEELVAFLGLKRTSCFAGIC